MSAAFLTGFSIGLGLILAIGAQNAFVLKQGLRGEHVGAVVLTCILSDTIAIAIGILFFEAVNRAVPAIEPLMRWGGAAFLIAYGGRSLWAAFRAGGALDPASGGTKMLAATLAACLAFTWLNPHFYLDTMVLLGAISTRFAGQQMVFFMGAATASTLFFISLGFGARLLRPVLATPRAWRALDGLIGVTMLVIAVRLLLM